MWLGIQKYILYVGVLGVYVCVYWKKHMHIYIYICIYMCKLKYIHGHKYICMPANVFH
jgi:hypothetical protein